MRPPPELTETVQRAVADLPGSVDAAGGAHGAFRLHVEPEANGRVDVDVARTALRDAYADSGGALTNWPYPDAATVVRAGDGVVITVDRDTQLPDPQEVISALAANTARACGVGLRLRVEPGAERLSGYRRLLAAGVAVRHDRLLLNGAGRGGRRHDWAVDDATTAAVVRRLGQQRRDAGDAWIVASNNGLPTSWPRALDRIRHMLPTSTLVGLDADDPSQTLRLRFDTAGHAIIGQHTEGVSLSDEIDALVATIRDLADLLEYAVVRDWHGNGRWTSFTSGLTPSVVDVPPYYIDATRELVGSYVPDAYGIQLLTDAHLRRAADMSDWRVEKIGPDRHLVSARDMNEWFGGEYGQRVSGLRRRQPPQYVADDVLQKARADFGGMILTRELVDSIRLGRSGRHDS